MKSSCFGDEHVLGDAAHRLPKNGCGLGRDEAKASKHPSTVAVVSCSAAYCGSRNDATGLGHVLNRRASGSPAAEGRTARTVAELGNWTGGSGQGRTLPANAEGRERSGSGGVSPYDGRSIRAGRGRWLGYVVAASVFSSHDEAGGLCEQLHFARPNVRGNLPAEEGAGWPRKDNLRQRPERPDGACRSGSG